MALDNKVRAGTSPRRGDLVTTGRAVSERYVANDPILMVLD